MKSLPLLLVVACLAACPKDKPTTTTTATTATPDKDETEIMGGNEAVYDAATPPDPRAAALCDALYAVPAARRAACCQEATGSSPMVATCTGVLSAALLGKALTLDDAKAKACAEAQAKALEGCGWVGVLAPPPPAACAGLFIGSLDEGLRCRSSFECKAGLRCHGSSALDVGRCGKARPARALCGGGIDGLAVVIGQVVIDAEHPECLESCARGRCTTRVKPGGACASESECGVGNRCENKVCVVGRLAVGAACVAGGCGEGARCLAGTCQLLRKEGESCDSEFDCARGGCVKKAGASGICGMHCSSWRDVATKPKTAPAKAPRAVP